MMKAQQTWSTPVKQEKSALIPCALCGGSRFTPSLACQGYAYVRCASCGLVQINPQPEKQAVQDRYGKDYLEYELTNEKAFFGLGKLALEDAGLAEIEQKLWRQGTKTVLEIGCATGALLDYVRGRGWDTCGVEISAPQAAYARQNRGLRVSTLPLEENAFPDASFSLVIASHLIEHLNEPARFIREIKRILVPGGYFLVTTPNIAGFQARLFASRWRSAIFDHLYLFSKKTLARLITQEDMIIEKTVTWGGIAEGFAPRPLKRVLDRAAKRFGFGDVMLMRVRKKEAADNGD